MFDTGFDIYDNTLIFKDKTITQEDKDTYYKVFKPNYSYENVMNQFDSFQKIKEFDEVKTGSVTLLDLYVTTKEKINFYSTHYNYEFYEDWLHASKSRSVVGIEPEYNYLFDKKIIDITEGRKLNSNEKYGIILYKGADKFSFTGSGRLSWIKYPAQSSTWNTSSTSILKYFDIRSINSADGVLSPRSILPTVLVLYPIAVARSSW